MSKIFTIIIIVLISAHINVDSVYSNWIQQEKSNNNNTFIEADRTQLPNKSNDISDDLVRGFLDENGVPLFSQNDKKDVKINTEDSLQSDAISERILNGLTAGDYLGSSVSGAGDVNGDGYEDVIVGAPLSDYTGANAGRAYIYFGGAVFNSTPDKILSGIAGELLGASVAGAGDVNGDGFDDVIVSLPGYLSNTGRAYIYYGGSDMNTTRDVTLTGEAVGDYFGNSVAGAGDLNGDGFADVIVGAPYKTSNTGKAYIYFGGSAMNSVVDVTLIQNIASEFFGFSVSSAGDFNGDGFSDVIVGAYGYSNSAGRTYMYLGGNTVDNIADMTLLGFIIFESFGYSVSSAGDFNGDGYSDIVIGGYAFSNSMGRVYLYFGGAVLNSNPNIVFTGQNSLDQFGKSVSGAGDVNGDGYDDIIIGAENFSSGAGKAYVFNGGNSLDNNVDKILPAEYAGDKFGLSVSGCGDLNGDGNSDFIVGAPNNDQNGASSGRAYVYFNSMSGSDIEDLTFTGSALNNYFGDVVSSAGDVNGDGYDDIIVGAYGYNSLQGRAYIYFGGSIMNNVADVTLTGVSVGDRFGYSVSTAGDVNGDGYSDVIVGAYGYNSDQGRAYIYYGGSSMNSGIDVTLTGFTPTDYFGVSVSSAGDVNGDGYSDVIVGASGYNAATFQGRVYIYLGGSAMNNTADVTMTGASAGDLFGYSASTAGDVNGDGFSDVIVSAKAYTAGTYQGRAYIYLGGSTMNNTADVTLTGASAGDYFGGSVSTAGDVNGDGYSDVIVGAEGYSSNRGRAYIYYGGTSMNSTSNVILTGITDVSFFGNSVSTAGDVNGDGYSDVIIGALNPGTSYVYFGAASMNNTEDITYTGENIGDDFGSSVSGAGDVNGDGLSDVLIGAYLNDEAGSQAGKAYLYFSTAPVVNPRIVSVKDVPFDQGGKVKIKWNRSGFDYINQNVVTNYLVEISDPPGTEGFYWETLTTIPANTNPSYQYTASTPSDSLGGSGGGFFYRVTAKTSNINQFWSSNIMSGYSVDNLSPAAPLNLAAFPDPNSVYLSWDSNTEVDMHHYNVYR
ncbi:MAG: FG-GAP-like repeat-containing protein, partial [Ignavibacteria bacterium]